MTTMELLTIQETADLLRVSPVTVRRYISARRLPAVRLAGKGVRVRKEDVESLPTPVGEDSEPQLPPRLKGKPTSESDPLWSIVGIAASGRSDVSENKYKYLAEAYLAEGR